MNGLAQITIDGQLVVLKFGLPALRRIAQRAATMELITGNQYNELGITHILYAGYVNACAMKDLPATIPFESFYEFVDEFQDETVKNEIVAAIRSFEDSKYVSEAFDKKKVMKESGETSTGIV